MQSAPLPYAISLAPQPEFPAQFQTHSQPQPRLNLSLSFSFSFCLFIALQFFLFPFALHIAGWLSPFVFILFGITLSRRQHVFKVTWPAARLPGRWVHCFLFMMHLNLIFYFNVFRQQMQQQSFHMLPEQSFSAAPAEHPDTLRS